MASSGSCNLARTSRKRRYCHCTRIEAAKSPMTHSCFIILLLAAYAVVVQGGSRTLRHNRIQHDDFVADGINASIHSRIDQRRILLDPDKHGNIIHYGIGERMSDHEIDNSQEFGNVISARTVKKKIPDINDGEDKSEELNGKHVMLNQDFDGLGIHMSELQGGDAEVTTLTIDSPEERNVFYDHAIGNGSQDESPNSDKNVSPKTPNDASSQSPAFYGIQTTNGGEAPDGYILSDGSVCVTSNHECCDRKHCSSAGDVCVNRNCIEDGVFRFTLQWIGDDDYDLFVITPGGAEISYNNFYDPASLGKFGEEMTQEGYDHHVENVFFPVNGAPLGVYRFFVRPFVTVGKSDPWTVSVVQDGKIVTSESGVGASGSFFCRRKPSSPPTLSPVQPSSPPTLSPVQPPSRSPIEITSAPVEYPNRPPLGQGPTLRPNRSPSLVPTIATKPSQPQSDVCSLESGDECCVPSDCKKSDDVCVQRTCIKDGNPRFTLTWTGDNDLDLFVITPDGVQISASNTNDVSSGGTYERDRIDRDSFGYRVENIYFLGDDLRSGPYEYGVRSNTDGNSGDAWSVEVYDEGELVTTQKGSGDSETFAYVQRNSEDGPQRPDQRPSRCSPFEEECCIDEDCVDSNGGICVQRTCINDGSLRITLEWVGDDDLSLLVQTPGGAVISESSGYDSESGGRYEGSTKSTFGFHVENVYFPTSGAPPGIYQFNVDSISTEGSMADFWTLKVYEDGVVQFEEIGFGKSTSYAYEVESKVPTPTMIFPVSAPSMIQPVPTLNFPRENYGSCTSESGCAYEDQVCVGNICISEGNPRFTLRWPGEALYKLTVITPDGRSISAFSPFDPDSGGSYEGPTQLRTSGEDIESVYFLDEGAPTGSYTYHVTNSGGGDPTEIWEMTVSVNGEEVATKTGSGKSDRFVFQFDGVFKNEGGDVTIGSPSFECDAATKCGKGTFCVKDRCIDQGTPQLVLTWQGYSDLSIFVATPLNTTLSHKNPVDLESGGKWKRYDYIDSLGSHIESVIFAPQEGPSGVYTFQVQSPAGGGDVWKVSVLIDGEEIASYTGRGSSETFSFDSLGKTPIVSLPGNSPNQEVNNPLTPNQDVNNPLEAKCSKSTKCLLKEVCAFDVCIKRGSPQFLLSWEGDYDIALSVVTPAETIVSWQYPLDVESGGKFEQYIDIEKNLRLENIHFASDKSPLGVYPYYVHSFADGSVDDTWTLGVYIDGKQISTQTGKGSSGVLFFSYTGKESIKEEEDPEVPQDPKEDGTCDPLALSDGECCSNSDCFPNEACASGTCVNEGNPRFTLSWEGKNDLDLLVVTPAGEVISLSNLEDAESGGKFGESFDQYEYGLHVENVYFPIDGGPVGEYGFYVRSFLSDGGDDEWTVGVFVNGKEQLSVSGTGSSQRLSYNFFPLFSYTD